MHRYTRRVALALSVLSLASAALLAVVVGSARPAGATTSTTAPSYPCDVGGSGDAFLGSLSPAPAFVNGAPTGSIGALAPGQPFDATYSDESGWTDTAVVTGPFAATAASQGYPFSTPVVPGVTVTPPSNGPSLSPVALTAAVPPTALSTLAPGLYAVTLVVRNNDRPTVPCTAQWLMTVGGQPDLAVFEASSLAGGGGVVPVGAPFGYSVGVTNLGTAAAINTFITSAIPPGLTVRSDAITPSGSCSTVNRTISCSVSSLAAGAADTMQVGLMADGSVCGSVAVDSVVSAANAAPITLAPVTVNIACPSFSVSLAKSASVGNNASVIAGTPYSYTLVATNTGGAPATGVVVSDTLPSGLGFSGSPGSTSGTCTEAGNAVSCAVGTLATGRSATITIGVTTSPSSCGVKQNVAQLSVAGGTTASSNLVTTTVVCPTGSDSTAPVMTLPGSPVTAEATGRSGATVGYAASAHDADDAVASFGCTPASGSTFPLGFTTVSCKAADSHGNRSTGSFKVDVVDTTPPALTVPGDLSVDATDPSGAVVNYLATARDLVDGTLTPVCTPPSGSVFPVNAPGEATTVSCTATDAHHNTAHATFTVHVRGPAEQLSSLVAALDHSGVGRGALTGLLHRAEHVSTALSSGGRNADRDAGNQLEGLIHDIWQLASGKHAVLSWSAADGLVKTAQSVQEAIGYTNPALAPLVAAVDSWHADWGFTSDLFGRLHHVSDSLASNHRPDACRDMSDLTALIDKAGTQPTRSVTTPEASQFVATLESVSRKVGC